MSKLNSAVADIAADVGLRTILIVWIVVSLIVALSGPFGTYVAIPFWPRLAYWASVIAASMAAAFVFRVVWRLVLNRGADSAEDILVVATLALAFGPFVSLLNAAVWPEAESRMAWHTVSLFTFLIGLATVVVRRSLQQEQAASLDRRDRLLDRIGAPEGARLGRISSDNHHIKIKLVSGEEYRVLMRFRDAVADIDLEPGICVHRSHWVALSQIGQVAEVNGREVVKLPCGSEVPVGPKYRANLVEMGVINA